jgi:hypothetical protein
MKPATNAPQKYNRIQIEMRVKECNCQGCQDGCTQRKNGPIICLKTPTLYGRAKRATAIDK